MKINKGKYIFSIALCILTFAVILAALPGCGDTGGNLQTSNDEVLVQFPDPLRS